MPKRPPEPWVPWWQRMCRGVAMPFASLFSVYALVILLEAGAKAAGWWGLGMAFLAFLALVWLSVAVHEAGHLLGGSLAGSHTLAVAVFWTEFHRERRGWRMRWTRRLRRSPNGWAMACPASNANLRRAATCLLLGGPLANGLIAAVCLWGVALIDPGPVEHLLMSAFLLNLVGLVANLMPFSTFGHATDGLRLLALRHLDKEGAASVASIRLQALSLEGVQAQALPEPLMQTLESGDPSWGPLLASWYRIVAARNVGDWALMLGRGDAFAAKLDAIEDETARAAWLPLRRQIEAELAFGRAIALADAAPLDDWIDEQADAWRRDFDWYVPHVLPRLQALAAAMRGDGPQAAEALSRSRAHADEAYDRATRTAEAALRARIEALVPDSPVLSGA